MCKQNILTFLIGLILIIFGLLSSNIWNKVNLESTSLKLFFILFPSAIIIISQIFVILESCY